MAKDRSIVFSVVERIQLLNILGAVTGNLMRMQLINALVKEIEFSLEDREVLELKTDDGKTVWNPAVVDEFELNLILTPSLYGALRGRFEELDKTAAIDLSILALTEKIFDAPVTDA